MHKLAFFIERWWSVKKRAILCLVNFRNVLERVMKDRNYVAKYARKFNKSAVMRDRRAMKRGERKNYY